MAEVAAEVAADVVADNAGDSPESQGGVGGGCGETFAAFIADAVRGEQDRTKGLDDRARGVQQATATGLGLVAAGGALLLGNDFKLPFWAAVALACALVALMVGIIFAAVSLRPTSFDTPSVEMMTKMLGDRWDDSEAAARFACAEAKVATVRSLREGNNTKAGWIEHAVWFQTGGFVLLGFTLVLAVFGV